MISNKLMMMIIFFFQDAKIMIDNIYYVVDDLGNGKIFRKFYVKVSKFDYQRVITDQFWASLEGVMRVTFVTEKELNQVFGKEKTGIEKSHNVFNDNV